MVSWHLPYRSSAMLCTPSPDPLWGSLPTAPSSHSHSSHTPKTVSGAKAGHVLPCLPHSIHLSSLLSLVLVPCAFRGSCQWESRDKPELQMRYFYFDRVPVSNGAAFWSVLPYDGNGRGAAVQLGLQPSSSAPFLSWLGNMCHGEGVCEQKIQLTADLFLCPWWKKWEAWICVPLSTESCWDFFLPGQLYMQWISESQADIPADQMICPVLE